MGGLLREPDFTIVETQKVKTKKPVVFIGFQSPGLIGVMAVSHIIGSLRMEEVGYLKSKYIPRIKLIAGSMSKTVNPFRIYANSEGDVLALVNDSPTGLTGLTPLFNGIGKTLVDWFHRKNARLIVTLGSIPKQKKMKSELVAYTMDAEKLKELEKFGIKQLQQGFIGGLFVSIVDECTERGIPWLMLFASTSKLGEMDIEGVSMLLDSLNKAMGLDIETESLKRMSSGRGLRRYLRRR